jgi:uncharacterized protein involved in exopolysaccharide biosynthesis
MSNWLSASDGDDGDALHRGQLLRPSFYISFFSRMWLYIVVPLLLISLAGIGIAAILPATYLSEGKLIVKPQQVSTELVRATVTSTAQDRLQAIEQRTMSRDNLVEIADKFHLFPETRETATANELVDLMRKSIKITVLDPTPDFNSRARPTNPPVVFTVGFEYSDAVTAEQIANELIQRILNEDVRDRTYRALNTTKFMAEEFKKLQSESAVLDAKVSDLRASLRKSGTPEDDNSDNALLSQLRQEYAQKSALYSEQHPVLKSLRLQIRSLESKKVRTQSVDAEGVANLEALVAQQEAARKTLDQAAAKLSAAQAGENLEKYRQSEQLEVLEPPTIPQRELKPNRLKIALTAIAAALGVGIFLAYVVNALDTRIRSTADIAGIVDQQLVATIPFISTRAEVRRKYSAVLLLTIVLLAAMIAASFSIQPLIPQLTEFVTKTRHSLSR